MAFQSSSKFRLRVAAAWLLVVPCTVRAQAPASVSADSTVREGASAIDPATSPAEDLTARGVEARIAGDEEAALVLFQRAHALEPSPRLCAHIGLSAKSLRRYQLAERYLRLALGSAAQDAWIASHREVLEQAARLVADHLANLKLSCSAPGARARINGGPPQAIESSSLRVPAGRNNVSFEAPGYLPEVVDIDIAAHETRALSVQLAKAPGASASSAPSAIATSSSTSSGVSKLPLYIGGAVAIAGAAAGTLLVLRAVQLKADRDEVCPGEQCPDERGVELDRSGRRAADFATLSFVVGGAGLGATLFWLVPYLQTPNSTHKAQGMGAAPAYVSYRVSF